MKMSMEEDKNKRMRNIGLGLMIVLLIAIGAGVLLMMRKPITQKPMETKEPIKRDDVEVEFRFARTSCIIARCQYPDEMELPFEYEIERNGEILYRGTVNLKAVLPIQTVVRYRIPIKGNYKVRLIGKTPFYGVAETMFTPITGGIERISLIIPISREV